MRKRVVTVVIGILLCWWSTAYSAPGDAHMFHNPTVLDIKLGLREGGGVVPWINVNMAGNTLHYDFYPWNGQQGNNDLLKGLGCMPDDGDRAIFQNDFRGLASPAGIVWDNPFGKEQKWEFVLDMGVVLQIPPEVAMTAAGRVVLNAPFEAGLIHGEKQFARQWDNFGYSPAVTFGFRYRF